MRKSAKIRQADILNVLSVSEAPMTAYQILHALRSKEPDIAPPTVYRALAALTVQGRAHKLESLKAFVPCRCDHGQRIAVLAICETCGQVEEHDGGAVMPMLSAMVAESKFKTDRHIVELHGQCGTCLH